jgi:hypothetical protein
VLSLALPRLAENHLLTPRGRSVTIADGSFHQPTADPMTIRG